MVDFYLNVYIYRFQSGLKHSEIQSDLKFIVLVVSLVFRIKTILWIKYTCAHILDTGLRIPVDLHWRDNDLFDIKFLSYLFIYLLFYSFVCMYLHHLYVDLFVLLNLLSLNFLVVFR